MVLNDTETVNTMLMDTGFTKMCLAAKCTAVQTIMDMLKNTKQVWVLRGGRDYKQRSNQKRKEYSKCRDI